MVALDGSNGGVGLVSSTNSTESGANLLDVEDGFENDLSMERRRKSVADPCCPGGAVVSWAGLLVFDKSKAYKVTGPLSI